MIRSAIAFFAALLVSGCSPAPDLTKPGAYTDLREEPKVRLLVVGADGAKTEVLGSLGQGSWREGAIWGAIWNQIAGDRMNRGQLMVETPSCGMLYFIVDNKKNAYCIGCREGQFRPEKAAATCPLQRPDLRKAWGSITWKIVD